MTVSCIAPSELRATHRPRIDLFDPVVVDNFAGGGGASLGMERALGRAVDLAINHDPLAVACHELNHPHTEHLRADVFEVCPRTVTEGRPVGLAWFSPDCRHFSRAKGGKPVNRKIRGLAWVAVKWAEQVRPRVIMLENVREFQDWGPLVDGRPCPARKGETFRKFVNRLRTAGYAVEWRVLNAAEYGAPTHRRRFFLIARSDGGLIVWPEKTHGPNQMGGGGDRGEPAGAVGEGHRGAGDGDGREDPGSGLQADAAGRRQGADSAAPRARHRDPAAALKPYRTAAECIDWTIPCPSIFERARPLADKTCRRIAMGIWRYVLTNPRPFIVKVQHGGEEFRGQAIDEPLATLTGKHGFGVVAPTLVQTGYGERDGQAPRALDPAAPLGTVVGGGQKHAVVAAWLAKHYDGPRGGTIGHELTRPIGTVTAKDHHSLATAHLVKLRGMNGWKPADAPVDTVCAGAPTFGVVESKIEPVVRVTSQGNKAGLVYAFLVKYFSSGGQWAGADEPLATITAKHRMGLVTVCVDGVEYIIVDIGLRMLTPRELARCQGFPDDYQFPGRSKAGHVKLIGNSVPPIMPELLTRANCPDLCPRPPKPARRKAVAA